MAIRLMANVPDQLIIRCVENVMQGYRQFDNAQAGPEMPPINRYVIDNELPKFGTDLWKIGLIQITEVVRTVNLGE